MHKNPKFQILFTRERHVEGKNFSSITEIFSPDTMIMPRSLRDYCNSIQILFWGYTNEKRLPFTIPEIRTFIRKLRQAWPYAPYFCDLKNSYLGLEAMAHVNHFSVAERDDSQEIHLLIETNELARYVEESHRIIESVGQRAGMTSKEIKARKIRLEDYLRVRLGPTRTH